MIWPSQTDMFPRDMSHRVSVCEENKELQTTFIDERIRSVKFAPSNRPLKTRDLLKGVSVPSGTTDVVISYVDYADLRVIEVMKQGITVESIKGYASGKLVKVNNPNANFLHRVINRVGIKTKIRITSNE